MELLKTNPKLNGGTTKSVKVVTKGKAVGKLRRAFWPNRHAEAPPAMGAKCLYRGRSLGGSRSRLWFGEGGNASYEWSTMTGTESNLAKVLYSLLR
jgi:hypothetical protein